MYSYKKVSQSIPLWRSCGLLGVLEKSSSCRHGTVPQRAPDNEGNLVFQCSFPFLLVLTHPVVFVSVHLTLAVPGERPQAVTHGRKKVGRTINSIFPSI